MDFPETDHELYQILLSLRAQSSSVEPLTEADVDARALTDLSQANRELKRRGLPDIYEVSGNRYEVHWAQPHGNSVTFHKERYGSLDESIRRAGELKEAYRDIDGYP